MLQTDGTTYSKQMNFTTLCAGIYPINLCIGLLHSCSTSKGLIYWCVNHSIET